MTAEVVALVGSQIALSEPRTDVVEALQDLLKQAEAGEILGFGYFVVGGGNSVTTQWVSGCAQQHLMITGAATLQHRVIAASMGD